jgi:ABC-type cobalamin/Fe3+-siderophores transport system ATPase subunit
LTPQRGRVDIASPIGYVPQKVNFIYDMTVLDAIVMGRYAYIGAFSMPKKADYDIARACAERLKITDLLDKTFAKLSGGQQQLVMVARALAVGPQCIIFDEPCAALDYGNQNRILSIIGTLKENQITAVFSTHDPNHALHTADKVLIMKQRPAFLFGPTRAMMTNEVLSALYGMDLQRVHVNDRVTSVVALFD